MQIDRSKADTPRLRALAGDIFALQGPCVGCSDCVGVCSELVDTLMLPELILREKRERS